VAGGAEFRPEVFRARDLAVGASGAGDLSAGISTLSSAVNLRATMQKSRRVNNFNRFTATRVCISLND
jgi:hypothetical protein